jgi:predicted phosphodiesterase
MSTISYPFIRRLPYLGIFDVMRSKTKLIARLATTASFSALIFFWGIPLASIESAFGYNVAAAGDWGCKDRTKKTVDNIIGKNPELVLALGDFSYQNTADCWLAIVDPIDEIMKITIGNHDKISDSLLNQYMSHFGLSSISDPEFLPLARHLEEYYSFDYQNAHFVVMSTEQLKDSSQYDFVKSDLAKASSNPNIDWIIVIMHKPMYNSGRSLAEGPVTGIGGIREKYHPLFDQYGVDLVLAGHTHTYERSYPLKYNESSPSTPVITNNSTGSYNDPEGEIFVTAGTAGQSSYSFSKIYYIVTQSERLGFLDIDLVGNKLVGTFYSNSESFEQLSSTEGSVRDQFSITKQ